MATPKTVTGLIQGADGRARSGTVSITLSQPTTIPGTAEVVAPQQSIAVDATGAWSALLYANNDLTPNGTYYTVRMSSSDGGFQQLTIQVPQTAGPFEVANLVTSTPTASPSPSRVTTLTVDGAATFTAGPVVIGTDPGGAQLLRVGGTAHVSGLLTLDAGLTVTAGAVSLPATSIADSALSANVALLSGAQTISGVKTFSANPVFNANAIPESAVANLTGDLAARALDSAVVHLAGAETISGAKTFSAGLTSNSDIINSGVYQGGSGGSFIARTTGANGFVFQDSGGVSRFTISNAGAVTIAAGLTVSAGNVTIGTANGTSVTNIANNIQPLSDAFADLGTGALRFRDLNLSRYANIGSGIAIGGAVVSAAFGVIMRGDHATFTGLRFMDANTAPFAEWQVGQGAGDGTDALGFYNASAAALRMKLSAAGILTVAGGLTVSAGGATITGAAGVAGMTVSPTVTATSTYAALFALDGGTVTAHANNDSLYAQQISNAAAVTFATGAGAFTGLGATGLFINGAGFAKTGNGTIANAYAIYASVPTIGTTNYALYINSGQSYFGGTVGFNGTAPIAKPTVSGAKSGNAALASLLTALAAYGLVTDSTTA